MSAVKGFTKIGFVLLMLGGFSAGQGLEAAPLGGDSLPGKDPARIYSKMLAQAKADPANTDWVALRQAYAASPAYDANVGHTPGAMALNQAVQRNDWAAASGQADLLLQQNWMDWGAHVTAAATRRQLGDATGAALHHIIGTSILRAILSTGTGTSPDSAIKVLATNEEYLVVGSRSLRSLGQTILRLGGHLYDRLDVIAPGGEKSQIFFNVDQSYARETAEAIGQVTPVPDTALPR